MTHISYTKTHSRKITRESCPDCKKRSYFVHFHQEWYGWTTVCMRCGRRWEDGEWMPLPFERGARENSKLSARKRWKCGIYAADFVEEEEKANMIFGGGIDKRLKNRYAGKVMNVSTGEVICRVYGETLKKMRERKFLISKALREHRGRNMAKEIKKDENHATTEGINSSKCYTAFRVVLRRGNGWNVKPEAEQLDGKVYQFLKGWQISKKDSSLYCSEYAMIPSPENWPDDAPTWVASGDLEVV